ncbi:hypothetical protein B0I35DRAFT_423807 [Stachybotrys elegans]|uniref:Uncharacterized protein n=1 Tax=Stachybotrys elegans TaxID=80388 RepID=A0A8K0WTH3_9HYPO|nr:hypothetical protein B0I35DRAFT_423807 [Stachybotrys elegans]
MADSTEQIKAPAWASFTKTHHSKPYPFISPTRPELSAAGKSVLITGGGSGIGKTVAIAFAQAGAASIAIIGRRLNRLQSTAAEITASSTKNAEVYFESGDIAQRSSIDAAVSAIGGKMGKIDIFVPCAGILTRFGPLRDYDGDEFKRGLDMNVMGAFNALQAFLPWAAPNAMVFNISSALAHVKPNLEVVSYAVNKIAIAKMFDYLAAENPDLHVVNIQPGVIDTEITDGYDIESQDEGTSSRLRCMPRNLKSIHLISRKAHYD